MDNLKLLVTLPEYSHDTVCPVLGVLTCWRGISARRKWWQTRTSRPVNRTNIHRRRWPRANASAHDGMTERCFLPLAVIATAHVPSAATCRSFSSRFHSRPPPCATSFLWCPRSSRELRAQTFAQNRTSRIDVLDYCKRGHVLNTLFAYVTVERA